MSFEPAISVRGVSKRYEIYNQPRDRLLQFLSMGRRRYFREFWALHELSFHVARGETVGIVGRNGSGKSTLLQIICGTLSPSAGGVETRGRVAALLELGSGFNPDFTGLENIYLYASILGLDDEEISQRCAAILEFADIGPFISQPLKTYSSGMVVRLAFATIIHVDPDILVIDEALAVGDTAFQQKCLSRIRKMQKEGVSILLVTHSTNTVVEFCDRAIFLKRGKLLFDGPCREVVKKYADDLVLDEGGNTEVRCSSEKDTQLQLTDNQHSSVFCGSELAMEIVAITVLDSAGHPCAAVPHGSRVGMRVVIAVRRKVAAPCFGIQLSSVDGIILWSCSTQSMGLVLPPLTPGTYSYSWELEANCSGNRYVFALGAGEILNGEYKRYHRLEYAGHIDVIPLPRSGEGWLAPHPLFHPPSPGDVPPSGAGGQAGLRRI